MKFHKKKKEKNELLELTKFISCYMITYRNNNTIRRQIFITRDIVRIPRRFDEYNISHHYFIIT